MTSAACTVGLGFEGSTYVVSLGGDLDYGSLGPVRASLLGAVHSEPDALVVDLGDLRFIDSSGLGVLVEIRRHALDRGVPIALRRPRPSVRTLLEMTGTLPNLFVEETENPRLGA